ncbi:PAS domain-containing sensor histidine kinase [Pseudomonas syringae group sp. J309-1]|uniref:hybrid sensor histidine kinase/response regulator n=1 Tax=Pseudomonas syringae group sp. J309-1 TaxID=3079588 RepID=UPI0029064989|nr:ATP-binding protein [Pseudomonas syringae group sp. J309-1]MDU8358400.1 ATP-binding protein [Pseudomonas syringae group sp. J309-1]
MLIPPPDEFVSSSMGELYSDVPPMIGGGQMGDLVRGTDWSRSSLGGYDSWPGSLRTALSLVLNAKGIAALYWGEQQWLLYNDAYGLALGDRHPLAFGRPMPEVLTDIGPVLGPQVAEVLRTGKGFAIEKLSMIMNRHGQDEETVWTYSFSPIQGESGGFVGVLLLATEMTQQVLADRERDKAEEARAAAVLQLEQLNARLEAEVTQRTEDRNRLWLLSSDIMLRCTFEGLITAVNPAWTALLGWDESELVGQTLLELIHPDDIEHTLRGTRMSADGHAFSRFDNRYRHKDGSYRWISWSTQPDEQQINAVGRDFTAEHDAAQALSTAEEALRQSQKLEAIGQLTGGVAHDFNNLLTVIKSSADLLKRPDLADERRARYVSAISDTVERAAKVTAQLLAFARRQALKPAVFVACDGVRALAGMIETMVGAQIQITLDLPEQNHFIRADPSQFDTALVNMALNARDAMQGQGSLTLRVYAAEQLPAVRTHPAIAGDYVAVSISDTGCGIPPQNLGHIFEPFYTTKGVGKGTGLGLSQVFGFAKQSGGEIVVTSVIGQGSTFTLYLPRVVQPGEPLKAHAPVSLINGHGTTVLVVEDNVDVGTFTVQLLTDLDYVPFLAINAQEALAELAKDARRFDIVFSDVVMPGMSGIDLGQEIHRLYPDLPVVLATGYSHELAKNGTLGFEILHKPYSVEQLSSVLQQVISVKKQGALFP